MKIDGTLTPELKREGLMREVIRYVQTARKNAGLNVDDRIVLSLETSDKELQKAIGEHKQTIKSETLAVTLADVADGHDETAKIDGVVLRICLSKHTEK